MGTVTVVDSGEYSVSIDVADMGHKTYNVSEAPQL